MNDIKIDRASRGVGNLKSANLPNDFQKSDQIIKNKNNTIKFIETYLYNKNDNISDTKIFIDDLFNVYSHSYIFDRKLSFNEIRIELKKFNNNINKILLSIDEIDSVMLSAIYDFEISHHDLISDIRTNNIGDITQLRIYCKRIKAITDRMLDVRSKKVPSNRVYEACKIIIDFHEKQTGKKFVRSLAAPTGPTARERANRQFKNPDAQFVKELMNTVDPELTFAMIQTGLKRALQNKAKQI